MFKKEIIGTKVIYTASADDSLLHKIVFDQKSDFNKLYIIGRFINRPELKKLEQAKGLLGRVTLSSSLIEMATTKSIPPDEFASILDIIEQVEPKLKLVKDELIAVLVAESLKDVHHPSSAKPISSPEVQKPLLKEKYMWVKKEVPPFPREGITWEVVTETEAAPPIHNIFLSTFFGSYHLNLKGVAAEKLFVQLKKTIKPAYFDTKDLLPDINLLLDTIDINLRKILERSGLEELQILLKNVYELISAVEPSFLSIQADLDQSICTNLLFGKQAQALPSEQVKAGFFGSAAVTQPSKEVLKQSSTVTAADIAVITPGHGYNIVAGSYDTLSAEWGTLKKGTFSDAGYVTMRTVKVLIDSSLDAQVLSFTEKHKATETFEYNFNQWETISRIYLDIQFHSESQAASFLELLYKNPEVIKFQSGMDRESGYHGEKVAIRVGATIQIGRYPGVRAAIKILSSDASLCPYEALVDYLKKTFTRDLELNPRQGASTTFKPK